MSFNNTVKKEIENNHKRLITSPELANLFLSCGFISDPQKEYRLEFRTTEKQTDWLLATFAELGITAHDAVRNSKELIYITASEQIEDILAMMGAQNSALQLMNIKIEKEVHNKANRIANCEIANVDKTARTNSELILTINDLFDRGCTLSEQVKVTADLILSHPEMSMAEMAKELKISKSGLYHRLQKIRSMSEEFK